MSQSQPDPLYVLRLACSLRGSREIKPIRMILFLREQLKKQRWLCNCKPYSISRPVGSHFEKLADRPFPRSSHTRRGILSSCDHVCSTPRRLLFAPLRQQGAQLSAFLRRQLLGPCDNDIVPSPSCTTADVARRASASAICTHPCAIPLGFLPLSVNALFPSKIKFESTPASYSSLLCTASRSRLYAPSVTDLVHMESQWINNRC
jgi:hypothetical protein